MTVPAHVFLGPLLKVIAAGPPPLMLLEEARRLGKEIALKPRTYIHDEKRHRKYADKWLNARFKWTARRYRRLMDECTTTKLQWEIL